jgi:anhydro-N-acetylmuramic acid kinase
MLAVGLMSGTSLDGIDAALVEIRPRGSSYALELQRFETYPFGGALLDELRATLPPHAGTVQSVARIHHALGSAYAHAARAIAGTAPIGFVASHGQTIWHEGASHITLQLGDAFVIREAMRASVCYDFRSADCAAGGQGAPLVAWIDALLLANPGEDRVVLNLGGIANVTLLTRGGAPGEAIAFDTGPGNMLIDAFVSKRSDGARTHDQNGDAAAAGRVDQALLAEMSSDAYFGQPPPKTTGRERFGAQFLSRHGERLAQLSYEDGAATLTELTAATVATAIERAGLRAARVIVSGGGASNRTLLARLAARLEAATVQRSELMGFPADAKEAMAFAVLGYETLRARAANLPAATGAAHATVLGAIAPHDLRALLARIEAECGAA